MPIMDGNTTPKNGLNVDFEEANAVDLPWGEDTSTMVVPMVGAGMDPTIEKEHRHPTTPGQTYELWNTNSDAGQDYPLPFPANTVIVHNWTPQYCKVNGIFVDPGRVNVVLRIAHATPRAKVEWAAPNGVTQPPSVSGAQLKTEWWEDVVEPTGGATVSVGVIAINQAATSTPTNVASSATSVTLLPANLNRKGASIFNDSTSVLYLLQGGNGTASITNYTLQIAAGGFYALPPPYIYTGLITGIWSAANGAARVTELS